MKLKTLLAGLVIILPFIFFTACEKDDDNKGTLNLSITDAPIDSDGITSVYITVSEVQYHMGGGNDWAVFEDFDGPQKFDLLELTRGESEMLGSFEMEAGQYTQLRFMLEAPAHDMGPEENPGCYLEFEDGSTQNLFVPSGAETGYKAVGAFSVPVNGSVDVTADFDVRKSVVKAGASGKYLLKPTIRLIVDDQAGQIAGGVSNIPEGSEAVIYAYEDGTYSEAEADDPADEETRFPNAVTSDVVDEAGEYHLAFLAPGNYELIVVETIDGEFNDVLGIIEDVEVESRETTNEQIDVEDL